MKNEIDYKAMCCDQPMRAMGIWPRRAELVKWTETDANGQRETILPAEIGDVYAWTYHCEKCKCYIGIVNYQEPRAREEAA